MFTPSTGVRTPTGSGQVDFGPPRTARPPAVSGGEGGYNTFKPFTGNVYREVGDLRLFAGVGGHGLEFRRDFNSRGVGFYRFFGEGLTWRHNYQWDITSEEYIDPFFFTTTRSFDIFYPDGTRLQFYDIGDGLTFRSPALNYPDYITREATDSTTYTLHLRDSFRYQFIEAAIWDPWTMMSFSYFAMQGFYDPFGQWYAFTNDDYGRFVRVTEPAGRWLEMTYDANGYISQVDASDGRTVTYNYTNFVNSGVTRIVLAGVDYGDGTQASYEYTSGQWPLLVHAVDPKYPGKGSNIRYTYWNDWGFLFEERHGETGEVLVSNYGNYVTYANGATNAYTWVNSGLQGSKSDALGHAKHYTYDAYGLPKSVTNENGYVSHRTNSPMGNVIARTHPDGTHEIWTRDAAENVTAHVDRLGRTNTYTRATNGLVTRADFPDGTYETFGYNGYNQVTTHRLRDGGTNTYTYATNGLTTAYTDAAGNVTFYGYDSLHRLGSVTNALGHVTAYSYNAQGLPSKVTHPDSTWVGYGYDAFDNRTSVTNELGKVWTYEFNALRQLTASTDPLGRSTTFEYTMGQGGCCGGGGGGMSSMPSRIITPSGRTNAFEYDAAGRKVAEIFAYGTAEAATNRFEYDAVGNLTNRIDALGNSWHTVFDAMRRPVATIDPLGRTNTFSYDAEGNHLTTIRPDGTASTNSYDSMNRLAATVDPLNQTNRFAYNDRDQLVSLTDARGNVTTWAYDALGRQTNKLYADSVGDTYRYDAVGRLTNHVNGMGQSQTLTYDSRNRLLTTAWNDGGTSGTWRGYDSTGHLVVLSNSVSVITNAYDDAGQMTAEGQQLTDQSVRTVSYTYNLDGQRQSVAYPSGLVLTNDYTARGQLASLTFAGPPPLVTYSYDLAGRRLMRSYENGVNAYYTNDAAGQLLSLAHVKTNGGSVIVQVDHGYNSLGNRTNRVESFTGFSSASDAYTYDSTEQLTGVSYSGGARTASYGYDAMGNLTNRQDTFTGTNTFTANNLNQLTAISGQQLSYDPNGNLTNRPGWLYSWNANNQLIIAEPSSPTNGDTKMTFAHDGRSRCVRRQSWTYSTNTLNYQLTSSQHLIYSGWNLIEERDGSGSNLTAYAYGPLVDEILARFTSTNTVFYHGDGQNSTLALSDGNGNVLERYRYEAFGLPSIFDSFFTPLTSSLYGVRHLFQGREWLAEVKLNDHRFRYYSPEMQRWLSRDPIEETGGINLNVFCLNSPLNYLDSDGLEPILPPEQTAAIIKRITDEMSKLSSGSDRWKELYKQRDFWLEQYQEALKKTPKPPLPRPPGPGTPPQPPGRPPTPRPPAACRVAGVVGAFLIGWEIGTIIGGVDTGGGITVDDVVHDMFLK